MIYALFQNNEYSKFVLMFFSLFSRAVNSTKRQRLLRDQHAARPELLPKGEVWGLELRGREREWWPEGRFRGGRGIGKYSQRSEKTSERHQQGQEETFGSGPVGLEKETQEYGSRSLMKKRRGHKTQINDLVRTFLAPKEAASEIRW
jgi:hypothetical protein